MEKETLKKIGKKCPNLDQLFWTQFNEDVSEGTTLEILNKEIFKVYEKTRIEKTIEEIDYLLNEIVSESDLRTVVSGILGARCIPLDNVHTNYREWLKYLKELFQEQLKVLSR